MKKLKPILLVVAGLIIVFFVVKLFSPVQKTEYKKSLNEYRDTVKKEKPYREKKEKEVVSVLNRIAEKEKQLADSKKKTKEVIKKLEKNTIAPEVIRVIKSHDATVNLFESVLKNWKFAFDTEKELKESWKKEAEAAAVTITEGEKEIIYLNSKLRKKKFQVIVLKVAIVAVTATALYFCFKKNHTSQPLQ